MLQCYMVFLTQKTIHVKQGFSSNFQEDMILTTKEVLIQEPALEGIWLDPMGFQTPMDPDLWDDFCLFYYMKTMKHQLYKW